MDSKKHPDYSDAYQKIYGSLEEKKTGMSSDAMGSILKGNKYSSKELFNMSKKSTTQGRHGEAHALYKEFQRKKTTKEGYQRDPDRQEKDRKTSKQTDPSKDGFTGIGDSIEDIMKQNAAMKAAAKKKTKKEEVGRHRAEFERYKEELKEHHAEKFNAWVQKLQEDGFDISRWEPQELIDTYIKENNLWKSRQTIEEAVGDGVPARIEGPQKGITTALCPTCGQFGCQKDHEAEEEEITEQELESQRAMRVAGITIPDLPDPKELPSPVQDPSAANAHPDLVKEEVEEVDEANKAERIGDKYSDRKLAHPRLQRGKRASKKDRMTARATADIGQRNRNRFDKRYGGDGSRKLGKFGSDFQVDTQSKDGLRSTSSDHAQKQRRSEHEARRGVKTKGVKKEQYSDWRLDILSEEEYDHWRDRNLEKYGTGWRGTDRSGPSSPPPSSKKTKGKTVLQRETEKKYGKGKSALDIVKAKIKAEHGKGAIMDTKKKK